MKNETFYFSLKNLSFLRNLNICPNFFVHLGKSLDKKTKVDFEIMNLNLRNKQLQYTFYPIFQSVKAIRQRNLVS